MLGRVEGLVTAGVGAVDTTAIRRGLRALVLGTDILDAKHG